MTEECAYKSSHPDVLAYLAKITADEWSNAIRDLGEKEGFGRDFTTWGQTRFAGFLPPADHSTVGKGWRVQKLVRRGITGYYVVPDLRTKLGKAHAKWFEDHGNRPFIHRLPGMRGEVLVEDGDGLRICTVDAAFEHEGVVYAHWPLAREQVEHADRLPGKVGDMWEAIPMSEYHLAREARAESLAAKAEVGADA